MTDSIQATRSCPVDLQRGLLPDGCKSVDVIDVILAPDQSPASTGILQLDVTYLGSEGSHAFVACWDGSWIETSPPGLSVLLGHHGSGDEHAAPTKQTLCIDMGAALRERPAFWAMAIANNAMSPATQVTAEPVSA
ncbi:hypothetical protein K9B35_19345 [Sphingomonas sp. R647]|uniref:hypothetical protein n=1 Tax=Sphingomonas sp. R647 TaxID=2875233 RepID=UPI001CD7B85F|nr:hypothetical protein [Sphingomonas sp. R647]MCA1200128.1 hypothetical protein [Sphingomonas sp. R647]